MLLSLHQVIDRQVLAVIAEALTQAPFIDGTRSAGMAAQRVKYNEEVDPQSSVVPALAKLAMGCLYKHALFRSAALPHKVSMPFFVRYTRGMAYGPHTDDPVMGGEARYRSDIAVTMFLSDPVDYDGGELVIQTGFGEQRVKLPAGDAVIYPASTLHHVTEVTRGERCVAVAWIQSLVRNPEQRELLYELDRGREKLLRTAPDAEETAQVNRAYVNLVRMWAEV